MRGTNLGPAFIPSPFSFFFSSFLFSPSSFCLVRCRPSQPQPNRRPTGVPCPRDEIDGGMGHVCVRLVVAGSARISSTLSPISRAVCCTARAASCLELVSVRPLQLPREALVRTRKRDGKRRHKKAKQTEWRRVGHGRLVRTGFARLLACLLCSCPSDVRGVFCLAVAVRAAAHRAGPLLSCMGAGTASVSQSFSPSLGCTARRRRGERLEEVITG
ncbi:hypothetical protein LZ31DRAFT_92556 [Colletotrichum somersetense]|nr:hypothetical protein LZ31DRAFT_92556 [Colletotrichum somersetense]